jgi:hypothetical protein
MTAVNWVLAGLVVVLLGLATGCTFDEICAPTTESTDIPFDAAVLDGEMPEAGAMDTEDCASVCGPDAGQCYLGTDWDQYWDRSYFVTCYADACILQM